jgi:hypothetical protein
MFLHLRYWKVSDRFDFLGVRSSAFSTQDMRQKVDLLLKERRFFQIDCHPSILQSLQYTSQVYEMCFKRLRNN